MPTPARTLIRGVRVFDGARVRERADVLVEGDRIAAHDPARPVDVEVDGSGRTLLPGLIDAHTHTFDGSLAAALRHGVTTELDMFCLPANLRRQRALAAARDDVADLRSSGVLATAPGGHPSQLMALMADGFGDAAGPFDTISRPEDAADFVATRLREGSDYLKIVIDDGSTAGTRLPVLGARTAAALVAAAHGAGLRTIAHAATATEAATALAAGVDGLAHAWWEEGTGAPSTEELAAQAAAQGVFVVSTLAYAEASGGGRPDRGAYAAQVVAALAAAGAPLLAGTDATPFAPLHGEAMHRELELLTAAGLTPPQALHAATAAPARHFGLPDRGHIAPGLRADLLLVDGDPTRDITAVRDIADVWRRGVRQAR
ncbi:amidohydrolase family protein [Streptomyces sp. NBC_00250]|uniref:amidohydrolase family protein n=1 Tax=Streptomyces sp. NBC_00250 TaxID=2903641 RepID=UPI002E2B24EE|nr:amidohydrolase family protein [Streptomyces sp. NBC_00250]